MWAIVRRVPSSRSILTKLGVDARSGLSILSLLLICLGSMEVRARADDPHADPARDERIVRTLRKLKKVDLSKKPEWKEAILRYLAARRGTDEYFELISRWKVLETRSELIAIARESENDSPGASAVRALIDLDAQDALANSLQEADEQALIHLVRRMGLVGDDRTTPLLANIANGDAPSSVQHAAVEALGKSQEGQRMLLAAVQAGTVREADKFVVAQALLASSDETIRNSAAELVSLPDTADGKSIPPLDELTSLPGSIDRGRVVFEGKGTCAKCHAALGIGKDIGPNLSEIGSKLSREALFVSVLDPSAGISHSFETYSIELVDGKVTQGLLVSDTEEAVTLKSAEGVVRRIARDQIEEMKKLPLSLMPAGLQRQLTLEELVDVVEFLASLKKRGG